MNTIRITALIIFVITYLGIIFNKLPFLNLDRKTVAFAGSVLMIVFGVISFEDAIKSIDFNTIALLLGMMIIISVLQMEGFFSFISQNALSYAKSPSNLLTIIVFITGFASAFLVNDAVVLLFTPIIINICRKLSLNPVPFLLGEIFSSNAGSLMTITGNPQNMIIGLSSDISYAEFMLYMFPVAIVSMLIIIFVLKKTYKDLFVAGRDSLSITPLSENDNTLDESFSLKNMRLSLIIFSLVTVGFFLGKLVHLSVPVIALAGSVLILMFSKHSSKDVLKRVDWSLLLFFASLFIIVAAVKQSGVLNAIFNISLQQNVTSVVIIFVLSLILSQLLSNVPYTILVLPVMKAAASEVLWLTLAASSTLAGNMTVIGAMANLIVIEQAEKEGVKITSGKFTRPAIVITSVTCLITAIYLSVFAIK